MQKFKPFGLGGSMVSILFMIGKIENINQKKIAQNLILDQSTMSRDLNKLVKINLLKITKGKDARNSKLTLTKKGYSLLEKISPIWKELHNNMTSILGEFNIQQIDNIIANLESNIHTIK